MPTPLEVVVSAAKNVALTADMVANGYALMAALEADLEALEEALAAWRQATALDDTTRSRP